MTSAPTVAPDWLDPFDTDAQVEAWREVLKAATGSDDVYEHGDVPGLDSDDERALPSTYTLLSVYRVPVPTEVRRWSGDACQSMWELELSHAGTTTKEAGWLFGRASAALDDQLVTLSGEGFLDTVVGPVGFVTHDVPEEQGEGRALRWIGRSTWAYGL